MKVPVLLVYPEEELRLGCAAVLNLRGINAHCASSPEEAQKLIKSNLYDVVVSGLRLEHPPETKVIYLEKPFTASRLLAALKV